MVKPKIVIIDYGVGNLYSLKRAFQFFGILPLITEDATAVKKADGIVLPGVGAFAAGMRGLEVRGLIDAVKEAASKDIPMLGICLGAQLLLSEGHEFGIFKGLNIIPGKVLKFSRLKENEKIPQVGWNAVHKFRGSGWEKSILKNLPSGSSMYFVHSYYLAPQKKEHILGLSRYGGFEFASAVRRGNIYGCQFHPEKSGKLGLSIIKNFINSI